MSKPLLRRGIRPPEDTGKFRAQLRPGCAHRRTHQECWLNYGQASAHRSSALLLVDFHQTKGCPDETALVIY
ncbi:hypothetical protein B0533_00605 [Sedimentibacter sp. SX930]|nr:hypothetical protein B0533_00605 [Sedimentibacter sp. SX930]